MIHIKKKKKTFKKREFVIHSFQDEGTFKKDHLEMPQGWPKARGRRMGYGHEPRGIFCGEDQPRQI